MNVIGGRRRVFVSGGHRICESLLCACVYESYGRTGRMAHVYALLHNKRTFGLSSGWYRARNRNVGNRLRSRLPAGKQRVRPAAADLSQTSLNPNTMDPNALVSKRFFFVRVRTIGGTRGVGVQVCSLNANLNPLNAKKSKNFTIHKK